MSFFTDLRIKIRKFFRKNKLLIFIIIIVWLLLKVLNTYLENLKPIQIPSTTYEPHVSVMDDTSTVPKKLQNPIEETLEKFITYCNNKEYENAYSLLSEECKKDAYSNDIEQFKLYVNRIFPSKKIYSIQDYSNVDGKYIYQVKIFDDFLATGLTDSEYKFYDEKITIVQDENKELKLLIGKFIEKTDVKSVAEDDYVKIDIKDKNVKYDSEIYHVKITNRSEYIVVIADGNTGFEEIAIDLGSEYRYRNDAYLENVVLQPGESKEYDFSFPKFYDDGDTSQYMIFNAIRIMENYTGLSENAEQEIENAKTKYSLKIKI